MVFLGAGIETPKTFRSNEARTTTRHVVGGPTSPRGKTQSSEIDRVDGSAERPTVDAIADRVEVEHDAADVERGEGGGRQATDALTGEVERPERPTAGVRRVHVDLGHGGQSAALDLVEQRAAAVALRVGSGGDRTDRGRLGR